jgi:large repetitive protein
VQDAREVGVPGIRMYLDNGAYVISDSEGKYSMCGLPARTYNFKMDNQTLPVGAIPEVIANRNALEGGSRFVDLKNGELHKADFALNGQCGPEVFDQIRARRTGSDQRGAGVVAPETERGTAPGQPATRPKLILDSSKPTIKPRTDSVEYCNMPGSTNAQGQCTVKGGK